MDMLYVAYVHETISDINIGHVGYTELYVAIIATATRPSVFYENTNTQQQYIPIIYTLAIAI